MAAQVTAKAPIPTTGTYLKALNSAGTIDVPPLPPHEADQLTPGITRLVSEEVVYSVASQAEP